MDKTAKLFDTWANTGRSEDMEKGHGPTVNKFFDTILMLFGKKKRGIR